MAEATDATELCVCGHGRFFHRKGAKCRHYACTCGQFVARDGESEAEPSSERTAPEQG